VAEPAVGNRVRLTGAERRAEILVAAQAVFTASGLGGARTSQIAEAAGVAESMLYKHFASKRELFDAAVTQPVEEFVQSVVAGADGLLDRDGPGSERFYRAFLETMIEVLPLLGVALFSDAEEGKRFYNASIVPLFDRYQEKVQRSLATVGRSPVDDGFLSRAVIGIMFLLALDATYREGSTLGAAERDVLAEKARSFVAGGLTGSGAGELLRLLGSIGSPDDPPPAPDMVSTADWSRYWARRAEQDAAARAERDELAAENATLRRILADQALELRALKDRLGE
jgi:AcrR family transcriptional regulator